jgi:hypothetical protein
MTQERPCAADEPDYIRRCKPDKYHDTRMQAYDSLAECLSNLQMAIDHIDAAIRLDIIPQDILSLAQEMYQIEGKLKQVLEGK